MSVAALALVLTMIAFPVIPISLPMAGVVVVIVVVRRDPVRALVGWVRPVAVVPLVLSFHGVMVAFDPFVVRTRRRWNPVRARRRRFADADANRNLSAGRS